VANGKNKNVDASNA